MTLELAGLEVYGHHGVGEVERREGQPFLYDVWLDVGDGALSDRLEDALDYRRVVERIRRLSSERRFNLLEALAQRGWSAADLAKLTCRNVLRTMRAVEDFAG